MEFQASIPDSSTSRAFDVNYRFWSSVITVCASGTDQPPLYALNSNSRGRNFTIYNDRNQEIGSSKIHPRTYRISVDCKTESGLSNTFEIRNSGIVFGSPCYTSPTFGGQKVTWKNKGMSSKIIYTFIDGSAMPVAHFESDPKSKVGKLEILTPTTEQDKTNELIVTLLTLLHRKLQAINQTYMVPPY